MAGHRIFDTPFASIYPHYVTKVERKGRSVAELHEVITWLTGYDDEGIRRVIDGEVTMQRFFDEAPAFNTNAELITGVICGHQVEEIEDPLMQRIRYLDKLVDELAREKKMSSILRG